MGVAVSPPTYQVEPAQNVPQATDQALNGGAYLGVGVPILPQLGTGGAGVVFEGLGTIVPRFALGIHLGAALIGGGDASPGASSVHAGYALDALLAGELLAYEAGDFRAFVEVGAGIMKTKPGLHEGYEVVDGDAINLALVPAIGIELGRVRASFAYAFRPSSALAVGMGASPDYATWPSVHVALAAVTVRLGGVPAGH